MMKRTPQKNINKLADFIVEEKLIARYAGKPELGGGKLYPVTELRTDASVQKTGKFGELDSS